MIPQKHSRSMNRVSLLIGRAAGMSSEFLEGISGYMRTHRTWIVQRKEARHEEFDAVRLYRPDGVIANVTYRDLLQNLRELKVPVLNVGGYGDSEDVPRVVPDYRAVGRLQAAHFIDRGHKRLICVGSSTWQPMRDLHAGAEEGCRETGIHLEVLDLQEVWRAHRTSVEVDQALGMFLKGSALPLALLTAAAEDAERMAQRCHELDLEIPEQVAILTVNDDAVSQALAYPPFSTVDIPWKNIGFEAAGLLDRLMRGETVPGETRIPPTGVTERRSTESIALRDGGLARAVAHIREHADRKILVEEVAKAAGMSRRLLEDRFHRHLGHSPFREIRHHQVQWVRQLLLETDLPLEDICDRSAFAYLSHMSKAFREEYGMAPGQYRKRNGSTSR